MGKWTDQKTQSNESITELFTDVYNELEIVNVKSDIANNKADKAQYDFQTFKSKIYIKVLLISFLIALVVNFMTTLLSGLIS